MTRASPPTPFTGTATDYARHRPPYPEAFLSALRGCAKSTGHGSLLDLACGPGRVAIPMARHFARVLAVDVEPDMIAVGEQEATARGVTNIAWLVARAEDLELARASIELITIGDAFHRLDQRAILAAALRWLEPRGAIATLGGEPVWRGTERWQLALVDVVDRWTRGAVRDHNAGPWGGPDRELLTAGFAVEVGEHTVERVWTCDELIGLMRSTSIASRQAIGDGADRFAAELRAALLAVDPNDRFPTRQRFSFTVGTRRTG